MSLLTKRNFPTLLDEFFGDWGTATAGGQTGYSPNVEVRKSESAYQVIAHLPGATKDKVEVEAKDGALTISGKLERVVEEGYQTVYSELPRYGEFKRSLRIDERSFDLSKVAAKIENGVLTVTLPVAEAAKPKRIDVQ